MHLARLSPPEVQTLRTRIRAATAPLSCAQASCQRIAELLYGEFRETVPLVRVYLTVPFSNLPKFNQDFVSSLASGNGVGALLKPGTPVLSLVGTCGKEPKWNAYVSSQGHVGIPLVGSEFVDSIPMISRLLMELGVGLRWLDAPTGGVNTQLTAAALSGKFYVENAATSVDDRGRKIIPAQGFVEQYGIRSVFGVGGTYLSPSDLLAVIFFTREQLEIAQLDPFMQLLTGIKAATARTVLRHEIFNTGEKRT
jgi:hypothetical protein